MVRIIQSTDAKQSFVPVGRLCNIVNLATASEHESYLDNDESISRILKRFLAGNPT
jgi:hypothetical protein